jgi:hypothetical protein
MKTAILVAVAIIILSSLPFVSRQTDAAAQENEPAHAIGAQRNASAVTKARDRFENARKSFKGDAGVGAALEVNTSERTKTLAVPPAQ